RASADAAAPEAKLVAPPCAITLPINLPTALDEPPCAKPLPINLPTALQLAGVRPLDIALAGQRVQVAAAQLQRARVLWLPTVYLGIDYFRHDGQLQDVVGNVFGTSNGG